MIGEFYQWYSLCAGLGFILIGIGIGIWALIPKAKPKNMIEQAAPQLAALGRRLQKQRDEYWPPKEGVYDPYDQEFP